ncbi:MAG: hypothetical protein ACXWL5_02450 [Candidatus Chromulinivorax sp.]
MNKKNIFMYIILILSNFSMIDCRQVINYNLQAQVDKLKNNPNYNYFLRKRILGLPKNIAAPLSTKTQLLITEYAHNSLENNQNENKSNPVFSSIPNNQKKYLPYSSLVNNINNKRPESPISVAELQHDNEESLQQANKVLSTEKKDDTTDNNISRDFKNELTEENWIEKIAKYIDKVESFVDYYLKKN